MVTFNHWQYYVAADNETLNTEQLVVYTLNAPLIGVLHSRQSAGAGATLLTLIDLAYPGTDCTLVYGRRCLGKPPHGQSWAYAVGRGPSAAAL